MPVCQSDIRDRAIAMLSTVHAGIEPAVLALLCASGAVPLAACGWVVGAGQLGLGAGALLCWRIGPLARRSGALAAAGIGVAASLGLAAAGSLATVLSLRFLVGVAMGLPFARATAAATRERPHRAISTILLGQQLLASAIMAILPLIAALWGFDIALIGLAAVPSAVAALIFAERRQVRVTAAMPPPVGNASRADARFLASLLAMTLLIAVVMMVWSYIAAIGTALGVPERTAGQAIALASLASAPAALGAYRAPRLKAWTTALACGAGIISPLLLPAGSRLTSYVVAMALFNAGSSFATVRFSAWAMDAGAHARGRRFVAMVQSLATAAGAPLGAIAVSSGGMSALGAAALSGTTAATILAMFMEHPPATRSPTDAVAQGRRPTAASFARSAATALAFMPFSARTAAISPAVNGSGFLPLAGTPSERT